jgi:hypothetical protein
VIFISEVQDAFVVTGEGLFIVPAIPQDDFRLRVKSPIQLRTPDGRILETHINAVEFLYAPEQISQDRAKAAVAEAHRHAKAVFAHPQNLDRCASRG